jgi:PKHD-type hydroxylase
MKYTYYFYNQFYKPEELVELNENLMRIRTPNPKDMPTTGVIKTAKVDQIPWKDAKQYLGGLEEMTEDVNQLNFGFHIWKMTDYTGVNYNTYSAEKEGQYGWHHDGCLNEPYDIKLTVVANISTDVYVGGEFEMFLTNGPKHLQQLDIPGSVLVFPSFIRHRVKPVTEGTRKTISFWIRGPNFR